MVETKVVELVVVVSDKYHSRFVSHNNPESVYTHLFDNYYVAQSHNSINNFKIANFKVQFMNVTNFVENMSKNDNFSKKLASHVIYFILDSKDGKRPNKYILKVRKDYDHRENINGYRCGIITTSSKSTSINYIKSYSKISYNFHTIMNYEVGMCYYSPSYTKICNTVYFTRNPKKPIDLNNVVSTTQLREEFK